MRRFRAPKPAGAADASREAEAVKTARLCTLRLAKEAEDNETGAREFAGHGGSIAVATAPAWPACAADATRTRSGFLRSHPGPTQSRRRRRIPLGLGLIRFATF